MLYDYYGFPPESYQITWPAPGEPALAARVRELLGAAGLRDRRGRRRAASTTAPSCRSSSPTRTPTSRPCSSRSSAGLDPGRAPRHRPRARAAARRGRVHRRQRHELPQPARLRRPARSARRRGLRRLAARDRRRSRPPSATQRLDRVDASAPAARRAHPREEHLLPLMVIAGAAGTDRGTHAFNGTIRGLRISAYHFGA